MIDSNILDLWGISKEPDIVSKFVSNKKLIVTGISSDLGKVFFFKRLFLGENSILSKQRSIFWFAGNKDEEFKYSVFVREFFDKIETVNFKEFRSTFPILSQLVFIWSWEAFLKNEFKDKQLFVFSEENPIYEYSSTKSIFKIQKGLKYPLIILCDELSDAGFDQSDLEEMPPLTYKKIGDIFTIKITPDITYRLSFIGDVLEEIEIIWKVKVKKTQEVIIPIFEKKIPEIPEIFKRDVADRISIFDDTDGNFPDFVEKQKESLNLSFTGFPETDDFEHQRYISLFKYNTKTEFVLDIKERIIQGWKLIFLTRHKTEILNFLEEEKIQTFVDPNMEIYGENVKRGVLVIGLTEKDFPIVPHSFQNTKDKIGIFTDKEIFHTKKLDKKLVSSGQKYLIEFLMSLKPGSYVVHEQHGIGCFVGIIKKEIDGISREYLEIKFAGEDKIFVPVDQTDKISKYITDDDTPPELSKLNSQEWSRVLEKAKEEARKISAELLNLYAKRELSKRKRFLPDTPEQKQFEEAFPYTETEGQLQATRELKLDMEGDRPMDRLICGDVGFGKTEVAMRAAFKSVMSGRQVAVVSPITILAEQHYESFVKRMAGFNVRIGSISRFKTKSEQTKILKDLEAGKIDIIIGTHRLIQADVKFKELGIVIVDEEQRFGVAQKEHFKKMRANVDILSLSATPIPRTLHLSLNKLRDISTISTPPPGRLPVITEVRKYSDILVREAILKEISRGGQVYFLHNRVETIESQADKLRKLIPEASFIVAHGQLDPKALEERILAFKNGEYNVLISSTIVENGIDLANANTLIVNKADMFGLSQLYQLRGRVGRGREQAYAYLLYHGQKLTVDAKKRLRAIVEASELGSGFQIALRDLEIRGAGDILGFSQHGVIKSVGVGHFIRLLNQAMEEIRSGVRQGEGEEETVNIELPFTAYIPDYFVSDSKEKVGLYQKLAALESVDELKDFKNEMEEGYGRIPDEINNLFKVIEMKIEAKKAGVIMIRAVQVTKEHKEMRLGLSQKVKAGNIVNLISRNPKWKISGNMVKIDMKDLLLDWYPDLLKSIKLLQEEVKV